MAAPSSTNSAVENLVCKRFLSSGVTRAGVAVMASVNSKTSFSSALNRSLLS